MISFGTFTLCLAATSATTTTTATTAAAATPHKRKSHKRIYDELDESSYENPTALDAWSSQQFEPDTSNDESDDTEDTQTSYEEEDEDEPQQQSFDEISTWDDSSLQDDHTLKLAPKSQWSTSSWSHTKTGWSRPKSVLKTKTIIKKIPVPYERPIKIIDNPIYTPVEKHIPLEHPVPVVKYVEKRVPIYQDHPVLHPIIKEEHVPQPYDQKVRFIVQKVYVHVPAPPVKQTIIIRKKVIPHHIRRRKGSFGWL